MKKPIQSIGIIGKLNKTGVTDTLKSLLAFLEKRELDIIIEKKTKELIPESTHKTLSCDKMGKQCDLIIVIGGDGSMLAAAHSIINDNVPMLGINRGRLGFLTDVTPAQIEEELTKILSNEYIEERRFLFNARVECDGKLIGEDFALNEVALLPGPMPHIIEFELYVDDQFVCSQHSDGLIIATPTGSTAYALSGGGPIVHPELDAMVIVPMFPHSLSARPIVISGEHDITLVITEHNDTTPRILCDGQDYIDAKPASMISIKKKPESLRLIHPINYDYYDTLRSKLHWGKKNRC